MTLAADWLDEALRKRLWAIVGEANVIVDPDIAASYCVDWSGRFIGHTPLVVRPSSTEEAAAVLSALTKAGAKVVPQGGNTGLVGGSVPLCGEAVLSLTRLNECGSVDALSAQATFGAGVTLATAQAHAAEADLIVGVDLAARDSATIGGMVATNAGGINVLRYGAMRAQIAGLEAVLSNGRILSHLGGLAKDNTGYDLAGLLAGSEGTLAVITAVRLSLRARPKSFATAMLACPSVGAGVAAAAMIRNRLAELHSLEAIFGSAMELVCEHLGTQPPASTAAGTAPSSAGSAVWLLVEVASPTSGEQDLTAELAATIDALGTLVGDTAVALDSNSRSQLWAYREQIPEAVSAAGIPSKLDVTLPAARMEEFVEQIDPVVAEVDPHARPILFGHLVDGNVHVNVLPATDGIDEAVLGFVVSLGGSISAEHGIGTAKKKYLHLNRSPAELDAFGSIKRALDPAGALNPNVLL